jgi:hypothetical protein
MKIEINNQRKIFAIEGEFSRVFQNLKIKFFAKPDVVGGAPSVKLVAADKSLESCRSVHNDGIMVITASMTIDNVKQNFRDVFGLSVQILKKSGTDWVVIVENENFTLEEHNKPPQSSAIDTSTLN